MNQAYDAGHLDFEEFIQGVIELTGRRPEGADITLDVETTKNEALLGHIAELRKDYKVGLLSNIATDWIRETFLTEAEQALFDEMIFSHDVGMVKPDPRIYRLMAERLEVEPEECVFVDDSQGHVLGAEDIGMKGVLYTDFERLKQDLEQVIGGRKPGR